VTAACAIVLALLFGACQQGQPARGIVLWTEPEAGSVRVAIEAVPGVLPATDVDLRVDDAQALGALEAAQVIDLRFVREGAGYRLLDYDVVGRASADDAFVLVGDRLLHADPGHDFTLRDQEGRPFGLDDLAGRVVLLDFIFTSCHGPCPAQTQSHVQVQRGLDPAVRDRTWFVSITIDPETDDEQALREYAARHGVDLSNWSFLTGPPDEVASVVAGWQIGTAAVADGQIDHTLVSYLLDDRGRIVHRYRSGNPDPAAVRADIEALVAATEGADG
jgi:protein SCO1/2